MNKYIKILLLFVLADLAITLAGINLGLIYEFNPVMAYLISHSIALFIFAKILFQCSLLKFIERYISKTNSSRIYYTTAIVAYIIIFIFGFILSLIPSKYS
jgi:hypothetical protein